MGRLDKETDPAVLRQAIRLLEHENQRLVREVVRLTKELSALKGDDAEQLRLRIAKLEQQLATNNKLLFGSSSEKRSGQKQSKRKKKQTGHGPRPQPELEHLDEPPRDLPEGEQRCNLCGRPLDEWEGQYEESEEIDVIGRRFVIRHHKCKKYRCACGGCIRTAPGPQKLVPGGRYSIAFAVDVVVNKYEHHLPLMRQVRIMKRDGLITDTQTLWDQCNRLALLLEPAYDELRGDVLRSDIIGADETTWRLLSKQGQVSKGSKRCYVWAATNGDAVVYQVRRSRSTEDARVLLRGFVGVVMCDGYSVYKKLAAESHQQSFGESPSPSKTTIVIDLAHCWAHVRREVLKAEQESPTQVAELLEMIGLLYKVERACKTSPDDNTRRARLRAAVSKPVTQWIKSWLKRAEPIPDGPLDKAIRYIAGHWTGLTRMGNRLRRNR